jgi:hypothetical protein
MIHTAIGNMNTLQAAGYVGVTNAFMLSLFIFALARGPGGGCYYDGTIIEPGQAYLIESTLSFIIVYVHLSPNILLASIDIS